LFQESGVVPVCIQFNNISTNDAGIVYVDTVGTLTQGNNSSMNTQYGILVGADSFNNVFIQNTALNNGFFDIADFSALTGNVYLCNTCMTDNRGGAICSSMSPLPVPSPPTIATVVPAMSRNKHFLTRVRKLKKFSIG
jgi:hypothetical protein